MSKITPITIENGQLKFVELDKVYKISKIHKFSSTHGVAILSSNKEEDKYSELIDLSRIQKDITNYIGLLSYQSDINVEYTQGNATLHINGTIYDYLTKDVRSDLTGDIKIRVSSPDRDYDLVLACTKGHIVPQTINIDTPANYTIDELYLNTELQDVVFRDYFIFVTGDANFEIKSTSIWGDWFSLGEFYMLFPLQVKARIFGAEDENIIIKTFLDQIRAFNGCYINHPETMQGLQSLASLGSLTPDQLDDLMLGQEISES